MNGQPPKPHGATRAGGRVREDRVPALLVVLGLTALAMLRIRRLRPMIRSTTGLLEFLGSVDSEDKDWHDYLARTDIDQVARRAHGARPTRCDRTLDAGHRGPHRPPPRPPPHACASATAATRRPIRHAGSADHEPRCHALLASVLLVAAAAEPGGADAAARPHGVTWSSLSPPQQQVLGRFQGQWDSLPPARQQALARGASRWLSMTPEQRSDARERFQTWQRLPPEQRALIRQRWQQFQQPAAANSSRRCGRTSAPSRACRRSSVRSCASAGSRPRRSSGSRCCSSSAQQRARSAAGR